MEKTIRKVAMYLYSKFYIFGIQKKPLKLRMTENKLLVTQRWRAYTESYMVAFAGNFWE